MVLLGHNESIAPIRTMSANLHQAVMKWYPFCSDQHFSVFTFIGQNINSLWPSQAMSSDILGNFDSRNGLSPVQHQFITSTSADFLTTEPSGTKFSEILIKINFTYENVFESVVCRPFCSSFNMLTHWPLGDSNKILDQVIFKLISVTDGWGISCKIALSWMPLDLTDDKSTLVQLMA